MEHASVVDRCKCYYNVHGTLLLFSFSFSFSSSSSLCKYALLTINIQSMQCIVNFILFIIGLFRGGVVGIIRILLCPFSSSLVVYLYGKHAVSLSSFTFFAHIEVRQRFRKIILWWLFAVVVVLPSVNLTHFYILAKKQRNEMKMVGEWDRSRQLKLK